MDLVEEKDRLLAHVELPGIDPKTAEINLQGDLLVKAQYKNGVLTVVLPKGEESVGRQIPVEVEK